MITTVFRNAYTYYRNTPILSAVAVLIYFVCLMISNIILRGIANFGDGLFYALLMSLLVFVVNAYWQLGLLHYHLADGDERRPGLCFRGRRRLGAYLVLQIAFGVILFLFALPGLGMMSAFPRTIIGAICFVLALPAAFYVLVRLALSPWYVIARKQDPFDAMQNSWRASAGRFWPILAVLLLTALLLIVGLLLLVVGVLPATSVAVYAHRALFEACDADLPQPRRRGSRN